ncbi:MAG: tetratricopeptide repeat protein [Phormidesmis sp.]
MGRLAEAEEIFKTALRLNPEDYIFYENLAEIAEERGDLSAAEAIYKEAIAANPRNLETHARFSKWLYKRDGLSTAAESSYREALEQFPDDQGLYDNLAFYLIYSGQTKEAIALLNQAIERGIEEPFVYLYLGRAFSGSGQQAEAEAAFRKAVLLSPDAYYELATFLEDNGRIEEAIAVCKKAIANGEQNELIYYKLGDLYLKNEQIEEAIDTHRELFRVHSSGDRAMSLAEVLLEQGQYAEAEALYRRYVNAYNDSSKNVQRWKRALVALGREKEADSLEPYLNARLAASWTATYQEAVRISPESGYYHYLLGNSLANQGQMAAAEAAYREALQLRYSAFLTTVRIGKTLFDQGLTERAEATYAAAFALEAESDDGPATYELSELYQNMGELRQAQGDLYSALNFYGRAREIDPYTEGITEKMRELESLIDKML